MRRRRQLRAAGVLACLLVCTAALAPAPARADADPPSDILLGTAVYYPFQPQVSPALQKALNTAVADLRRRGLDLKVAIVATKIDLGAIPNLFGQPQTYARFLDQEISFNAPQPLLTVMPEGFGVSHAGPPSAVAALRVDASHQANGLARSALLAVLAIARAAGKPLPGVAVPPATGAVASPSGTSPVITFGGPVLLVVLIALAVLFVKRRALAVKRRRRTIQ